MTVNEWAQRNAGYLTLLGLGITSAGFLLLPIYLRRDVTNASAAGESGWPWLDYP
jgi:hypothetical protein